MKYFIPAIVLILIVGIASVAPKMPLPEEGVEFSDKIAHFLAYFLLAFALAWGYFKRNKKIGKRRWGFILAFGLIYGFMLEMIQWTMPYRQFDGLDLLANVAGVLASMFVFKRFIA